MENEPSPEDLAAVRNGDSYDAPAELPVAKKERKKAGTDLQGKGSYLPDIHRLLPQSPDAERGVLSSFLLAPAEIGGMCAEKGIDRNHFYIPSHAEIFNALRGMWDANKPIDFISLTRHLRDRDQLDAVGGAAFITDLFTFLPTAANAAYYIEILEEKYTLREIIKVGTEFASRSYYEQSDVPNLLDNFEERVLKVRTVKNEANEAAAKDCVVEAMMVIERTYENRGSITGIATGFHKLDKLIDGIHTHEMTIIAARPSMGKTALAMNIADFMAVELNIPVGVFSLEMSKGQLAQRMICSRARVNMARVRDGFLSERDFPALSVAAAKLAESKLRIDDSSDLSIQELRARARRWVRQYGMRVLFVDYLQLLRSSGRRSHESRQQEVAEISAGLKSIAKELGIAMVVLAQLSRGLEQRSNQRPRLSDLRESGSIEQDADLVAFITRPEVQAENDEERLQLEGIADLIIAKSRNGPIGEVPLTFLKEYTRFESRATGEAPDDHPRGDDPQLPL